MKKLGMELKSECLETSRARRWSHTNIKMGNPCVVVDIKKKNRENTMIEKVFIMFQERRVHSACNGRHFKDIKGVRTYI